MSSCRNKGAFGLFLTAIATLAPTVAAMAVPTKFVLTSHFGWNVNKAKVEQAGSTQQERNICTVASKDACQFSSQNSGPGGFAFPTGVAVAPNGNVYVADKGHARIQEFDSEGRFVLMFGWNVNKAKIALGASATQAEKNICTAAEVAGGARCEAGEAGTGLAEQLSFPSSVAVGQNGDVYVMNFNYHRVDEYTENGTFVLMIGKKVNRSISTPHPNLCSAAESAECGPGEESAIGSTEQGAFKPSETGNVLAIGPKDRLLYVGDEGRVQTFEANGVPAGEISLVGLSMTGRANDVAVDSSGDLFVADSASAGVREYVGGILQSQVIGPGTVTGLALDAYGRLGLVGLGEDGKLHGFLYSASGTQLSEFNMEGKVLAFAASSDNAYVAVKQEIGVYELGLEVHTCSVEEVLATGAVLCGEVNPNGVLTRAFFNYMPATVVGTQTPVAFEGVGAIFSSFHWTLTGLVPNEIYKYGAAAEAEVGGKKASGSGEEMTFETLPLPPAIESPPVALFVRDESAVLFGSLNPENATTKYRFEYGACKPVATCTSTTADGESSAYADVDMTREVIGLLPSTTYHDRLVAENEVVVGGVVRHEVTDGPEGTFTTGPPVMVEAVTGAASAVTTTSAVVSGTVNPDGQPATYAFELGVYNGEATQYGVVFSGSAGEGITPVPEELQFSGLRPGTTYAYRIRIESGYGSATGTPVAFTTAGLPSILAPPTQSAQLAVPSISFPDATKPLAKCRRGYSRDKRGRCVRVRHKKKRGRAKRV